MDKKPNIIPGKLLPRLIRSTVFNRLVNEVEAYEIPPKYIEKITVYYANGSVIDLLGDEISKPVPVNHDGSWEALNKIYKNIEEVTVFINTPKLEIDINEQVEGLLRECPI